MWRSFLVVFLLSLTVGVQAEVVGPLMRVEADFPDYAVFQVNGRGVSVGDTVVVLRQGRTVAEGQVSQVKGGRCLVKFQDSPALYRGDLLHARPEGAPSLGVAASRQGFHSALKRPTAKLKPGRSPHVLTPEEFAAQSRERSRYTLGRVRSVKAMAEESRRTSVWTLGRTMTVEEFAQQMNR